MVVMAKRFGSKYRLQALSIERITSAWEDAVTAISRHERLSGRKPKLRPGTLLNALVLRFLEDLDEESRVAYAAEALSRLDEFMEGDGPPLASPEPRTSSADPYDRVAHSVPRDGSSKPRTKKSG